MSLFDSASLCVTPNGVKEGKLYSIKPTDGSGDLSVTRATTATRVNSAGLVEVVPRNILTYSEQFNNSDWAKGDMTVTANAITAPNGTLTADKIIATSNNTAHVFYQVVPTGVYSFSIYAKADEETLFSMWLNDFSKRARFDLSTGTITDSNVTNSTITDVGNGWYRCEIYDTSITSYVAIYGRTGSSYIGNDVNGMYFWGAQAEIKTTATDYYPTTTRLNIPRLDYTNGSCPSILVEPQRTNNAEFSQSFDNAYWTKTNVTLTSTNGGIISGGNYFTITCDGTPSIFKGVSKNFINASANTYTLSVFAKAGNSSTFVISSRAGLLFNDARAIFNLSNGTIIDSNAGTATITPYADGWYRCSFTVVNAGTFTNQASFFFGHPHGAADGATVLATGAMSEIGSYATSYIPTTSASVTRNADVISKTGISSLIGQTEGTIFTEIKLQNVDSNSVYAVLSSGSFANSILIGKESGVTPNKLLLYINASGTNILNNTSISLTSDYIKCAIAYKSGNWAAYVNGNLIASGSSTFSFSSSLDRFGFANDGAVSVSIDKIEVKSATLWKERLTNEQLATLTTI
jgi:hypothetical protein